jgi:Tfp pilus assembly protein PilP
LIRNRAGALIALGSIVAVAVAGCGGGSDSSSKQDFAKKADQICADTQARVTKLSKSNPKSRPELVNYIEQLKAAAADGVKRLSALERPEGDAGKTAKQFTDLLEQQYTNEVVPALDRLRKAVNERDKKGLKAASKSLQDIDDTQTNRLATELGAKGCAQS